MEQAQLDRIEAKLDRLLSGPESPTVDVRGVMEMTGAKTPRSAYRILRELEVRPYARGIYRRVDIRNAQARAVMRASFTPRNQESNT